MQKHLNSGEQNTFNMVWEFRLSFQQFIDAKVGNWNYPWVLTIVMTFLVRECYGSLKKQEF
jgi:hypothetical protein